MNPYRTTPKYLAPLAWWVRPLCALSISGAIGVLGANTACTKAQGVVLESGVPAYEALVTCVIKDALGTAAASPVATVVLIAEDCGGQAVDVARILYNAATLPKGARNAQVAAANAIRSTPAFADAYRNYPQSAP